VDLQGRTLPAGARIYLIGICGTAMASLAGILKEMGFIVSGSDQNVYPPMDEQLRRVGIPFFEAYRVENIEQFAPDFVIIGNVISKGHVEAEWVIQQGIPYSSLPAFLGEAILRHKRSLVVCGTHGKTTTTSLLAWVLDVCGRNPGFLIGGIAKNFGNSFRYHKDSEDFVIEGDEYDTAFFDKVPKFTHYAPAHAILTSVEFDHADIYSDLQAVKMAFAKLPQVLRQGGQIVAYGDDPNIRELMARYPQVSWLTYGQGEACSFRMQNITHQGSGVSFALVDREGRVDRVECSLWGEHNARNVAAVWILATKVLGLTPQVVMKAMLSFQGVRRRSDVLGVFGGVTLVEDFAHHPTAVSETLKALRQRFSEAGRIWVAFEPRSATSRRAVFQQDYVHSFLQADGICVKEAFDQSKIPAEQRFSSQRLVEDLQKKGKKAFYFSSTPELAQFLVSQSHAGDLIVVMSNGGFDGIFEQLKSGLASRFSASAHTKGVLPSI
jgi:UDP-N-acetylmuramate: L-alanyl-gamma-D-glutamyl-meso-diaminopimelate ligase